MDWKVHGNCERWDQEICAVLWVWDSSAVTHPLSKIPGYATGGRLSCFWTHVKYFCGWLITTNITSIDWLIDWSIDRSMVVVPADSDVSHSHVLLVCSLNVPAVLWLCVFMLPIVTTCYLIATPVQVWFSRVSVSNNKLYSLSSSGNERTSHFNII